MSEKDKAGECQQDTVRIGHKVLDSSSAASDTKLSCSSRRQDCRFDHGSENPGRRGLNEAIVRNIGFGLCGLIPEPVKLLRSFAPRRSGEAVSNPQDNRERNLEIAENEATRERKSDVRLTSWAIGTTIVVALIVLAIFLKR
ncbi:MAG: hypothetical protein J0G36_16250 [Afipia sp.]|nr:hypothetical protein [Afipia sp.]